MGVYKRAFLYVKRKKVRSILLFLIFFVTGLFLLTGISIKRSAGKAAEDFQKTLKTGLRVESIAGSAPYEDTLDENGEKVRSYDANLVREHHIAEILAIEGVSGFYCDNLQRSEVYTGLTLHPGYSSWCMDIADGKISLGNAEEEAEYRKYVTENREGYEANARTNSFLYVYDSEWHPAFVNGALELVEGRHIRADDKAKVVISDEVAGKNDLKIGDKITAQLAEFLSGERYGETYEMEIAGIFHINFEQKIIQETFEDDILANVFFSTTDAREWSDREWLIQNGYTPFATVDDDIICLMTIFLEDPSYLDSVKEKLLAIDSIDWEEHYTFGVYDKDYQTAAAPLLSMMKISNLLAVISEVGVLVILYLVLTIWMRSRKHEIGILTSMGVKKNALRQQFFIECGSIAATAFIMALLLSGPVTKLAGDGLQTLIYSAGGTEKYEVEIEYGTDDMYINMQPPEKEEALPYTVTVGEAGFVFLLLFGTMAVAVLASSAEILGQKPREILGRK